MGVGWGKCFVTTKTQDISEIKSHDVKLLWQLKAIKSSSLSHITDDRDSTSLKSVWEFYSIITCPTAREDFILPSESNF
jgi:hypothetical protein